MSQYIFKNTNICDISSCVIHKKDLYVKDGIICEISDEIPENGNDRVIDLRRKLLSPYGVGKQGVELRDLSKVDVGVCVEAAQSFADYVIGIKLRIDSRVCEDETG